jgi:hypothetical protein
MYHATYSNNPDDKRPVKIRDMQTGKCVATSTTQGKAEADIRRRYEGEKK